MGLVLRFGAVGRGQQVKKVSGVKDLRHSFEIFARKALGHNLL